jgi:hypothetical protein
MAMDGLRGYLQLASGLAEMSRARATEAASALLSLSSGLTSGRSSTNVQLQVQELAEELLAAAAANRRSLIALVRSEVERAVARSPIPPDELDRARAAVAKLSADVEALQAQLLTNPAVGEVAAKLGLVGHGVSRPVDEGVVVDAAFTGPVDEPVPAPPRRRPPRSQIAGGASTRPVVTDAGDNGAERPADTGASSTPAGTTSAPTKRTAAATNATTKKATAKKATTKKATAKKATTKKATAKKAAPARAAAVTTTKAAPASARTGGPAQKSTAKKSAAKKSAAKKTAIARTATTKAAPAKKAATTKTATKTAAKKTAKKAATSTSGSGA